MQCKLTQWFFLEKYDLTIQLTLFHYGVAISVC
jgi:hypothetical protein